MLVICIYARTHNKLIEWNEINFKISSSGSLANNTHNINKMQTGVILQNEIQIYY